MSRPPEWTVVVLAGGGGTRLGGVDKSVVRIDGRATIDHLLDGLPEAVPVVVAGPERHLARTVAFRPELPPDGGPVAGIAAALDAVRSPHVVIVATDMPWAGPIIARLIEGFPPTGVEALIPVDADGREQPLCSAWDTGALKRALTELDEPRGASVRSLVSRVSARRWQLDAAESRLLADIDSPADLAAARQYQRDRRLGTDATNDPSADVTREQEEGPAMDEWIDAVRDALGLDVAVDIDAILDVARVAAHAVDRPAAPVTTFLLGVAVARGADPAEATRRVDALAAGWPPPA